MLANTTSCRLSDHCHPQSPLPPVNATNSGRRVVYSCGTKAQARRVSSTAAALLALIPSCLPGPGHRKSCCWEQPDVRLSLSSCCIDQTILPLKVSVSQQRCKLGEINARSELRGPSTHTASAWGALTPAGAAPRPPEAAGYAVASFSLLFSPEESQLTSCHPLWWQNWI